MITVVMEPVDEPEGNCGDEYDGAEFAQGIMRLIRNHSEMQARLDSRDFYELCQEYRHARVEAAKEFEAIKTYLLTGELPWPSYDTDQAA